MKMGIIAFGRAGGLNVTVVIIKIASDPKLSPMRTGITIPDFVPQQIENFK